MPTLRSENLYVELTEEEYETFRDLIGEVGAFIDYKPHELHRSWDEADDLVGAIEELFSPERANTWWDRETQK